MLAQSLFLDRLSLVAGNPLTYVAFIIVVLAWVGRWYFLRTRKYLEALPHLPDSDRLKFAQMVVLGFPQTLTENRLKVIQWKYMLIALVASLLAPVSLAGLAVHYWSLSDREVNERFGRIEETVTEILGMRVEEERLEILRALPLDERRLASERLDAIASSTADVDAYVLLANQLAATGRQSKVTFKTREPGATVRYRFIGRRQVNTADGLTNESTARMTIGFYYIWAERDGEASSSRVFRKILKPEEGPIYLSET